MAKGKAKPERATASATTNEMKVEMPRIPNSFKIDLGIGAPRRFKLSELSDDMLTNIGQEYAKELLRLGQIARKRK